MANVVLFGNGPVAEVALALLRYDSSHEVVACTVDKEYINNDEFNALPVIPFENISVDYPPEKFKMFLPVSYKNVNELRKGI